MDLLSFTTFVDNTLLFLQDWGFLIVIVFGIIHPLIENPFHLFNLTLAIGILGIPLGFIIVFLSNIIGILMLYYFANKISSKSNDYLKNKKVSGAILQWVKDTETWKHIVVIGAPLIPTYPIKIAIPFSGVTFKKYMVTLIGSYLFLFLGDSLIYFGVTALFSDFIPEWLGYVLLILFACYIYFGKYIFNKEKILTGESI